MLKITCVGFLVDFWADRVYYKTVAYVTGLTYPMR